MTFLERFIKIADQFNWQLYGHAIRGHEKSNAEKSFLFCPLTALMRKEQNTEALDSWDWMYAARILGMQLSDAGEVVNSTDSHGPYREQLLKITGLQ